MSESGPTWLLMIRDVSKTVRIADQPCVIVSVIVDADTGLVRAVTMADTVGQACAQAVDAALSRPRACCRPGRRRGSCTTRTPLPRSPRR